MTRLLFVANGHGENAIAARVAEAVTELSAEPLPMDLLSLVGVGAGVGMLQLVGPRRTLPSGGLIAMGNVAAFARDVLAGFPGLLAAQMAFLVSARRRYAAVIAVGDAYALALALLTRLPTLFIGTAKSVFVAPYGPFERILLRRAKRVWVRDAPTAQHLALHGTPADAPGNVIADLAGPAAPAVPGTWLGLVPGSRASAYADGVRLAAVARILAHERHQIGALLSIAPGLDAGRFARVLEDDGWVVACAHGHGSECSIPFEARTGGAHLVAWQGAFGAFLAASRIVVGQAGTANEQAAAHGIPVATLGDVRRDREDWYRMRQRRLLGPALALVPAQTAAAAQALDRLLADPEKMAAMSHAGRARMGPPGGAAAIAHGIMACLRNAP